MRGSGGAELTDGGGDGGEASLWPPAEGGGEAPAPRPPVVVWPDGWEVWVEDGGGDLVAFLDLGVFSPPAACCFCCCRHLARRFLNHTWRGGESAVSHSCPKVFIDSHYLSNMPISK